MSMFMTFMFDDCRSNPIAYICMPVTVHELLVNLMKIYMIQHLSIAKL